MESLEKLTLNHQDCIKRKLKNVLSSEPFCNLCYETDKSFISLNEKLKIVTDDWTQDICLKDVYSYIFNEMENLPARENICSECTEQLQQSYIFIKNAKLITGLLVTYIDDLESKSNDLITHLVKNNRFKSTNIVIVLENNNINKYLPKDFDDTVRHSKAKKIEANITPRTKLKSDLEVSFKRLDCSKELPTLWLWKQHTTEYRQQDFKCNICFKTFKNQQYLTSHYKVHSKLICKICHLIVPDGQVKDHMRKEHKGNVFVCNICADVFYTLRGLATHVKIVHTIKKEGRTKCDTSLLDLDDNEPHDCELKCFECIEAPCIHNKYLISYREQVLNHVSKVKCLDCDYVCREKEILIGHVNREHLNHHPYICNECGQQFYAKAILKTHIQGYHREIDTCKHCDLNYNHLTLRKHEVTCKIYKRGFVCPICQASFASDEDLAKHEKQRHTEVLPCGMCKKVFLKESKRKAHTSKVHSGLQIKNKLSKLECVVCEKMFDTKGELMRHRKKHGPNVKYPCRICNTEYVSLRKLRAHSRKHVGPFATCDICGKEMRKVLIEKHIKNHEFDGIVSCTTCGKSFQNLAMLKYHKKSHLDNIPCPICGKMINPAKLRRHVKVHEIEENPSLKENQRQKATMKCEFCDYVTWNNIVLESHMNRHHFKTKPYVCHICSKDFFGNNLLKKHIQSHTLNKSVVCMVCGKTFANATCLKLHLRLHTGEKNYPCDVCGEKFRSSSIMNVHKLKRHADKEIACPLCPSKFYTLGELRRHVIKVHWKDKGKKFDPRELKGLENHYHLFHDGRRVKMGDDVDFYIPCTNNLE